MFSSFLFKVVNHKFLHLSCFVHPPNGVTIIIGVKEKTVAFQVTDEYRVMTDMFGLVAAVAISETYSAGVQRGELTR